MVPSKPFNRIQHLSYLNLQGNDIDELDNEPFKDLSKLEELNLNGCQLDNLQDYSLIGLDSLRKLDLSENNINTFPTKALNVLKHLEFLEIGSNYFKTLKIQNMINLKNLKYFSITGCKSGIHLNSKTFHDNSKLEQVNITKCSDFTELESNTFTNLPHLKILNFHQCGLTNIRQDVADWSSLEYFDLSNNPIDCHCDMNWLQHFYKNSFKLPQILCKNGQILTQIELPSCENSNLSGTAIILIVITCILCAILIGLLSYWYCYGFSCFNKSVKKRKIKRPKRLESKFDIVPIPIETENETLKLKNVQQEEENIYQELEEMPLGSTYNYPDIKTTVL